MHWHTPKDLYQFLKWGGIPSLIARWWQANLSSCRAVSGLERNQAVGVGVFKRIPRPFDLVARSGIYKSGGGAHEATAEPIVYSIQSAVHHPLPSSLFSHARRLLGWREGNLHVWKSQFSIKAANKPLLHHSRTCHPEASFLLSVKQREDPGLRVGPTQVRGGYFWGGGQDCLRRMQTGSLKARGKRAGKWEAQRDRTHTRKKKAIKLMQVGCHKVIDISRAEQFTVWKRRRALA